MRLIDADKLRKQLLMMECMEDVVEIIDNEPTAYDVDKVVEELENLVKVVYEGTDGNIHLRYSMETILKAIEIVKHGGD